MNTDDVILNEYLTDKKRFTKALFKRPESLSKFLIYEEYLKEYGIFVNKDGSFGAIYELDLLEHEPLSGDQIVDLVGKTKTFFKMPENCSVQIIHEQKAIAKRDKVWNQVKNAYPFPSVVSEKILDDRIELYKNFCEKDELNQPLRRSTLICFRFFPEKKNQKTYKSIIESDSALLLSEVKSFIADLRSFDGVLKDFESNKTFSFKKQNAQDLTDSLRSFFNPKEYYNRDFVKHSPTCSISDQVIYKSPSLSFEGIEREGVKTKTITLKNCPQFGLPGGMASFLKLDFPYKIALNFSLQTKEKVKRGLKLKTFFLERTLSAEARKQKADLDLVQEKLAHGDRCLQMTFNIIVEGESDNSLNNRIRKVLNIFNNDLECEAIVEEDIGLGLCLNSLPLMYSADSDISSRRSIKILQSDAQKFVPIFDSFKGTKDPMQLFLSRENNIVPFSIIDENRASNHSCVVADTGSGKSAFVLDIAQSYKRKHPDPLIFYIEKRASSKMLCRYFGGDFTEFKVGNDIPFTPFRGQFDDSKVNFLSLLIGTAINLSNPNFVMQSEHSSIIGQALKVAYNKKIQESSMVYEDGRLIEKDSDGSNLINMDDVVNAIGSLHDDEKFKTMSAEIDELIKKLREYYGDGKYADFFKGNNKSVNDKGQSFYVYDLDGLESDPKLQALVTLSIFEEIRRIIALPENKLKGGLIVFEELGQLGKNNPTAAKYIIDFSETIRKLGFNLIFVAPRPKNFFETDAGRAAWDSADNYFFLQLKPDSVNFIKENSEVLDDTAVQIVKSIKTVNDRYVEVYYTNKDATKAGAFKFLRAPIDKWVSPTNPQDDYLAEKTFKECGEDPGLTLKKLLELDEKEIMEVAV